MTVRPSNGACPPWTDGRTTLLVVSVNSHQLPDIDVAGPSVTPTPQALQTSRGQHLLCPVVDLGGGRATPRDVGEEALDLLPSRLDQPPARSRSDSRPVSWPPKAAARKAPRMKKPRNRATRTAACNRLVDANCSERSSTIRCCTDGGATGNPIGLNRVVERWAMLVVMRDSRVTRPARMCRRKTSSANSGNTSGRARNRRRLLVDATSAGSPR